MKKFIYYNAKPIRVIDGDSVVISIDFGAHISWAPKAGFRLAGIDTPERTHEGFVAATERLKELLADGITRVETYKPTKYGAWSADIWIAGKDGGEIMVNQVMIAEGHAVRYTGGKKATP